MPCRPVSTMSPCKRKLGRGQESAGASLTESPFDAELKDFSDTAALIELMDLVISVDTSVAHLAGAMGKDVWILLPCVPDWRWLLDRPDSPWYASARLFRQAQRGQWANVLAEINQGLQART